MLFAEKRIYEKSETTYEPQLYACMHDCKLVFACVWSLNMAVIDASITLQQNVADFIILLF